MTTDMKATTTTDGHRIYVEDGAAVWHPSVHFEGDVALVWFVQDVVRITTAHWPERHSMQLDECLSWNRLSKHDVAMLSNEFMAVRDIVGKKDAEGAFTATLKRAYLDLLKEAEGMLTRLLGQMCAAEVRESVPLQ